MAEEFQGGVCGGNYWWNSRNLFGSSSPCLLGSNDVASFNWLNQDLMVDMKTTRSSDNSAGFSSSTSLEDWNHDLFHDSGKSEDNYSNILQEAAQRDANLNNFGENSFKQVINGNFPLEQQPLNTLSSSNDSCQSNGFPLNSNSFNYASSLLQTLFDIDSDQSQQSLLDNNMLNYSSATNYNHHVNSNELTPCLPINSPMVNTTYVKQQLATNHSPFVNNLGANFLPWTQPQFLIPCNKKRNLPGVRSKHQIEEAKDLASVTKKAGNDQPSIKRARIETPSLLPTFKVRKEKLGDRVTALQQLVSPFGKTDTASVLHEAIEYIKFLHDQANVLSTPYLKYGSSQLQNLQANQKVKDQEGLIQDLKSRGLCLVPISSTFPIAADCTTDFWTPMLGERYK